MYRPFFLSSRQTESFLAFRFRDYSSDNPSLHARVPSPTHWKRAAVVLTPAIACQLRRRYPANIGSIRRPRMFGFGQLMDL